MRRFVRIVRGWASQQRASTGRDFRRRAKSARPRLESLEPRRLLSADPVGSHLDHDHEEPSEALDDGLGNLYFFDPAPSPEVVAETAIVVDPGGEGGGELHPLTALPILHSNPGASHSIFLDFDGHTTGGTAWNQRYTNDADFTTPAFSTDGDTETFSDSELARIERIWQRVAEDFRPFNVDVTTENPGVSALSRSNDGDGRWGIRVVVGGDSDQWYTGGSGGVGYVGSFNWETETPAFVFENNLGNGNEKFTAESVSHEVGHSLGLSHDGIVGGVASYGGHGSGANAWAPIMGLAYNRPLSQWSSGEYQDANQTQDDVQIITSENGFGFRDDLHGNSSGSATFLEIGPDGEVALEGIIEERSDVDFFVFATTGGMVDLDIQPFFNGPNLDILATLYNESGQPFNISNPLDELDAAFHLELDAGTYFLSIEGVNSGDPLSDGYSDYASLGAFTITGNIANSAPDTTAPLADLTADDVRGSAESVYQFVVTYTDEEEVDIATLGSGDVRVTGPGGFDQLARMVEVDDPTNGTPRRVTYEIDAPGDAWDNSDNGTYSVSLEQAEVADVRGNAVVQQLLGAFEVALIRAVDADYSNGFESGEFDLGWELISDSNGRIEITSDGSPHEGGFHMTMDAVTNGVYALNQAILHVDLSDRANARLEFYWMDFTDEANEQDQVAISVDGGNEWVVLTQFDPVGADGWQFESIDLDAFGLEYSSDTLIRFQQYDNFAIPTDGMAFDSISVTAELVVDESGAAVISHTPTGNVIGEQNSIVLTFDEPMDTGSFAVADDVVAITGPGGTDLSGEITGFRWSNERTLTIQFFQLATAGDYSLTLGSGVLDAAGNPLNQNGDDTNGQESEDRYTANFTIDNSAPIVSITSPTAQTVYLVDAASMLMLELIVADDGIGSGALATSWSVISGPGEVAFADAGAGRAAASFAEEGTYVLEVIADDGDLLGSDRLTVQVGMLPGGGVDNTAPQVSAGADASVVGNVANLAGAILDDENPDPPAVVAAVWSLVDGPAAAVFGGESVLRPTVTVDEPGDYVFRLTADDGQVRTASDVQVTFTPGDTTAPQVTGVIRNDGVGRYDRLLSLEFAFDEDVSASIGAGDLTLLNESTGEMVDLAGATVDWNSATMSARWDLSVVNIEHGYLSATLSSAGVTDAAGNALDGDGNGEAGADYENSLLLPLPGDTDLDGDVDINDALQLVGFFGGSGDWSQGDTDFDGDIDIEDALQLVAFFGGSLSEGPIPAPAALPVAIDSSPVASLLTESVAQADGAWQPPPFIFSQDLQSSRGYFGAGASRTDAGSRPTAESAGSTRTAREVLRIDAALTDRAADHRAWRSGGIFDDAWLNRRSHSEDARRWEQSLDQVLDGEFPDGTILAEDADWLAGRRL